MGDTLVPVLGYFLPFLAVLLLAAFAVICWGFVADRCERDRRRRW